MEHAPTERSRVPSGNAVAITAAAMSGIRGPSGSSTTAWACPLNQDREAGASTPGEGHSEGSEDQVLEPGPS